MALYTYVANRDGSFVSEMMWGQRRLFIGDTVDLSQPEVDLLSTLIVLSPGTVPVDLSTFPYELAKYMEPTPLVSV
jgi:hypothetical protein